MIESQHERTTRSLRWLWIIAAGLIILTTVCVSVTVFLWIRSGEDPVTPALERSANAALQNPASAAIDLGSYGYTSWYPANGTDYAVENGMVIFPQPQENSLPPWKPIAFSPDKTMPALVYAPGRQTLPQMTEPPIPDGRSWAYMGEWFLYRCAPISAHPGWWLCMLLVGGNI